jgi:release factor glutamine methyltransferase
MRRIPAKIISPALQFFIRHYFKKARPYRYKKIKITVLPGVFFPHFTLSTKLLLQFLEGKALNQKTFLELGCGTGIISVFAAQKGAKVVASDINPQAIKNAELNATNNAVSIQTVLSDLFDHLPLQQFDTIVINPPYYPRQPKNDAEKAWFCGEEFEYFTKLFPTLPAYFHQTSEVFMILSEDCKFDRIQAIAETSNLKFEVVDKKRKWGEWSLIYRIRLMDNHKTH